MNGLGLAMLSTPKGVMSDVEAENNVGGEIILGFNVKIGKKNIIIPKESSIKIDGSDLTITGPKGTKKLTINDKIFSSKLNENEFKITPLEKKIDKKTSILWGTYRSLINNAIMGVSSGHEKILELNGVDLEQV